MEDNIDYKGLGDCAAALSSFTAGDQYALSKVFPWDYTASKEPIGHSAGNEVIPLAEVNSAVESFLYTVNAEREYMGLCEYELVSIYQITSKPSGDSTPESKRILYSFDLSVRLMSTCQKRHNSMSPSTVRSAEQIVSEDEVNRSAAIRLFRFGLVSYRNETMKDGMCIVPFHRNQSNSPVSLVVAFSTQSFWLDFLLASWKRIQQWESGNARLILVEFCVEGCNSTTTTTAKQLEIAAANGIKNVSYVPMTGLFQRALGIQTGLKLVEDDNEIIVTGDMNLFYPVNFLDMCRRMVIPGRQGFSPIFFRLEKGIYPSANTPISLLTGRWEYWSFGIFAAVKKDWDKVGGLDTVKYTTKWGGEDDSFAMRWKMASHTLSRLKIRGFFHYFHPREGSFYSRK